MAPRVTALWGSCVTRCFRLSLAPTPHFGSHVYISLHTIDLEEWERMARKDGKLKRFSDNERKREKHLLVCGLNFSSWYGTFGEGREVFIPWGGTEKWREQTGVHRPC